MDGSALRIFREMVAAQGGDLKAIDAGMGFHRRGSGASFARRSGGYFVAADCTKVGWAVQRLGAGREKAGEPVEAHAGLEMHVKLGAEVEAGQVLATLFAQDEARFAEPEHLLAEALTIGDAADRSAAAGAGDHLGREQRFLSESRRHRPIEFGDNLQENALGRFTGVLGLLTMLLLAWIFSTNRRAIRWRTVVWGLALQILFAFCVVEWTVGQKVMHAAGGAVNKLLAYAFDGSTFVFGDLGAQHSKIGAAFGTSFFAFQVLPTIIFISAFFAVLYYLGIMQLDHSRFRAGDAVDDEGLGGGEPERGGEHLHGSNGGAADDSALSAGGDALRADDDHDQRDGARLGRHHGGLYPVRHLGEHLLAAVIMTAPGTILISKMLVPETEKPATEGVVRIPEERASRTRT